MFNLNKLFNIVKPTEQSPCLLKTLSHTTNPTLSRSNALSSELELNSFCFITDIATLIFFKVVFNLRSSLGEDQTLSVTRNGLAFPEQYFHKQKIWKLESQVGSVLSKYQLHFCEADNHLFNMSGIICVILFNGCYKCSSHTEKRSQLV